MRFLHLSCVALILAGLLGSTGFAGELARFSCTEYADRDWPRMLVGYDVSFPRGKARLGNIRLVDDQGVEHPVQLAAIKTHGDGSIQSCRVHFYAELTAGGSYLYRLETGKPASGGKKGVTGRRRGDRLEVSSSRLAVELPAPGSQEYSAPKPGNQVPAPILRFRLHDGKWAGRGSLQTK